MIYLSDNDIVEKLAICDLLDEALNAFGASRSEVYVLETLRYRIGLHAPSNKTVRRLGQPVADRLVAFLAEVQEIRDYSKDDQLLFESLDEAIEIDAGEIILFSATANHADYLVLTGDKKCLRALVRCPECEAITRRIQGRVVCFEQIIRRIIAGSGFAQVRDKVVPVLSRCDTVLQAAFGSGAQATEENVRECIDHYIASLRDETAQLLVVDE